MSEPSNYEDYVNDESFLRAYNAYQAKYVTQIRESDKVLIELVRKIAACHDLARGPLRVLDIGCSTGNLLLHLKRLVPGIELTGGDLAESSLVVCRDNRDLAGITFERLDLLDLGMEGRFDVIIANAVGFFLSWDEYRRAARGVTRALRRGGTYIAFEWLHPFRNQDIVIIETTLGHPNGLRIYSRPMPKVVEVFEQAGFTEVRFMPFDLPIDLAMPGHDEEVVSYTKRAADGTNLCFRGTLFQPWCHMSAVKAA